MPKQNGKGQASILTRVQIGEIIELASDRYRPIFAIAAYTGCRISEARSLTAKNLNLDNGYVLFAETKTKVDRVVPLHPDLVNILRKGNLPTTGYLFPSPRSSGPISREAIAQELKAIAQDLGVIGVSTHSFRRSVATHLHEMGKDLKTIASITGHKDLNSLSRYIDVSPEKQMAAIMALG
jgi:integrase/recombinase XerD